MCVCCVYPVCLIQLCVEYLAGVLSMWLFVLGVLCGGLDATMLFGHTIVAVS